MKNLEDAAREIYLLYKEKDRVLSEGVLIGFMKCVEFAQEWYSVEDELPERDSNPSFNHQSDIILLKDKSGNIFSGYYDYDMASFFNYIDDEVFEIIEWRPIELN